MHISGLAADERLIGLNFPRQPTFVLSLKGETRTLKHEPSRLLGNSHSPVNLPGRNAVLAVSNKPDNRQPLIQTQGRIFKDRSGLERELTLGMMTATLPAPRSEIKSHSRITTCGARNAERPSFRNHVGNAVIRVRKVSDCFFKRAWRLSVHVSSIAEIAGPASIVCHDKSWCCPNPANPRGCCLLLNPNAVSTTEKGILARTGCRKPVEESTTEGGQRGSVRQLPRTLRFHSKLKAG